MTQDNATPSKVVPLKPPTASELRSRLLSALPSILHYLLPAGVLRGGKFMVGNAQGDKGDSLVVEINGAKAGLWHDFATGAGGDIIDLWAVVKGFDRQTQFPALLQDIQTHLGSGIDTRPYKSPLPEPQGQSRKLGKPTAKWDYTDAHGNIIASVYRYDSDGRKEFRPWDAVRGTMRAPDIRPLYNQVGLKDAAMVVLAEGEKCAQALISASICATTAMNGAKAPVNKTDWSPLQGKHVIIWPDHDEPGLDYARRAASAAARAGAVQVEILKIPPEKPPKWDAADAVAEGLDIEDIMRRWERVAVKELPAKRTLIPMYSITELQADKSPIPDDLIAPRVLTPGGTLVFGGAPKVGKSDFLISLLTHMAAGVTFLGMSPKCPLKIFYLQAEIQYDYLRERVNNVHIVREYASKLHNNFVITPQISVTLDDNGVECVAQSVKERFGSTLPDIIVIDPLRNVFDGGEFGGENDNDAMMFFLSRRVEALRQKINPNAGIIIAHHTKKIFKKQTEEDPFQSFSGAGALRSYYTSGILLHRPDESRSERTLLFELRNGREITPKIVQKKAEGWVDVTSYSPNVAHISAHTEPIVRLLCEEGAQNRVYTARQFSDRFENHGCLGSSRLIRQKLQGLIDANMIKFFKNGDAYGFQLPKGTQRGYLWVDGMSLPDGRPIQPTHHKHDITGEIVAIPSNTTQRDS